MSLTITELDSIRRRADAATPGPWTPQNWGVNNASQEITIASFIETKEDTQFIAHAREDIPELLTEIYRQREEIESLTRCPETCLYIDRLADQLSAVIKERDEAVKIAGSYIALCYPPKEKNDYYFKRKTKQAGDYLGTGYDFIDMAEKVYSNSVEHISENLYTDIRFVATEKRNELYSI